MTIEIFFESPGYSEKVAEVYSDEVYMKILPILQEECENRGFVYLTESIK
jgi:hypothetical protein